MNILGFESSCDETAVAVVRNGKLLSSTIASQFEIHAPFGGVVPELASRRHLEVIAPLTEEALKKADLSLSDMDGIAATCAPGLLGCLLVGLSYAKGMALARRLPFVGVNHLEGHLNAVFLENTDVPYPHIGLIVSGGHTSLYNVYDFGKYKLLGATRDDAAGEAFDKVAKLLDLGFPGGPVIDRLAKIGNPNAFRFSRPKFDDEAAFDFSFSGLKTAVLVATQKLSATKPLSSERKADLAASFQKTVVDVLVERMVKAVQQANAKACVISGGVAANSLLRQEALKTFSAMKIPCFIPSFHLCTDNAGMIAYVGEQYLLRGKTSDLSLNAIANQEIGVS